MCVRFQLKYIVIQHRDLMMDVVAFPSDDSKHSASIYRYNRY